MLLPVGQLLRRLRQPSSRARELERLRRRLQLERRASATAQERAEAAQLRLLKDQLARMLGPASACGECTRGLPAPEGAFDGGHCCSGLTADVFSDDELAALALGGTRGNHLRAPLSPHWGCAFRGPDSCSLAAVDRPSICARYQCTELRRELHQRDELLQVQPLLDELGAALQRFVCARTVRRDNEEFAAIHPGLVDEPVHRPARGS